MKALISALAAASMTAAVAAWSAPTPAYDHVVRIDEKTYNPDLLDVAVGDKVIWKNFDSDNHSVTAEYRPALPQDKLDFDSGVILSGGSFEHDFVKEGTYKYYCRFHPEVSGTVTVHSTR